MALAWYRTARHGTNFEGQQIWLVAIPLGTTLRRIRWSWGFAGTTSDVVDMAGVHVNPFTLGLVTTVGNGTETPPNALDAPYDAAPPTQRWLWWETREPIAVAIDHAAGVIEWRDSGPQEPVDVKSQVIATGFTSPNTLNLWASWASGNSWDSSGQVIIWVSTSVLYG